MRKLLSSLLLVSFLVSGILLIPSSPASSHTGIVAYSNGEGS